LFCCSRFNLDLSHFRPCLRKDPLLLSLSLSLTLFMLNSVHVLFASSTGSERCVNQLAVTAFNLPNSLSFVSGCRFNVESNCSAGDSFLLPFKSALSRFSTLTWRVCSTLPYLNFDLPLLSLSLSLSSNATTVKYAQPTPFRHSLSQLLFVARLVPASYRRHFRFDSLLLVILLFRLSSSSVSRSTCKHHHSLSTLYHARPYHSDT
jgi:hypothetical protein